MLTQRSYTAREVEDMWELLEDFSEEKHDKRILGNDFTPISIKD